MTKNYTAFSKIVHQNNKDKGWYDNPRSNFETLILVMTELAEAIEELRNGSPLVWVKDIESRGTVTLTTLGPAPSPIPAYTASGKMLKPEGVLIEVADAVIRLMDFFGHKDWDVDVILDAARGSVHYRQFSALAAGRFKTDLEFCGHLILAFTSTLSEFVWDEEGFEAIGVFRSSASFFILECEKFCSDRGFDLKELMEFKCKYNTSRPYRHGGKLA